MTKLFPLSLLLAAGAASADSCLTSGLPRPLLREGLAKCFSRVVQPRVGGALGSCASLDLKDASAEFAVTSLTPGGGVAAFTAKGAASEGVLPILRGDELNSDLALGLQYSALGLA